MEQINPATRKAGHKEDYLNKNVYNRNIWSGFNEVLGEGQ